MVLLERTVRVFGQPDKAGMAVDVRGVVGGRLHHQVTLQTGPLQSLLHQLERLKARVGVKPTVHSDDIGTCSRRYWRVSAGKLVNVSPWSSTPRVTFLRCYQTPPCMPPNTNHIPTTYKQYTNNIPTTDQPHTGHMPTKYQPHTDHMPTKYQPHTDHIPTTCQPHATMWNNSPSLVVPLAVLNNLRCTTANRVWFLIFFPFSCHHYFQLKSPWTTQDFHTLHSQPFK